MGRWRKGGGRQGEVGRRGRKGPGGSASKEIKGEKRG